MATAVAKATLTYSTSINVGANLAETFFIAVTDGVAFTINAPTSGTAGQRITFRIRNTSGGAMGAVTWNGAYKLSAWVSPATGFQRAITFETLDGTNFYEIGRTPADVPN